MTLLAPTPTARELARQARARARAEISRRPVPLPRPARPAKQPLPDAVREADFSWFPDWSGETVVLVGAGPSAAHVELTQGIGRAKFIAINNSWKLAPWADVLYACDASWWRKNGGMPDWPTMRLTQDRVAVEQFPELRRVFCQRGSEGFLFDQPGYICWGGNGGMQAMNVALQWGAAKLILVGYDMTLKAGVHWHGKHPQGLSNPTDFTVERWRRRLDNAAKYVTERGVKVYNCSPQSALQSYPKTTFAEALDG